MEIELTNDHDLIEEEKKEVQNLLPFWARQLLAMKDEAEKTNKTG